jgi:hypothetical protein
MSGLAIRLARQARAARRLGEQPQGDVRFEVSVLRLHSSGCSLGTPQLRKNPNSAFQARSVCCPSPQDLRTTLDALGIHDTDPAHQEEEQDDVDLPHQPSLRLGLGLISREGVSNSE